MREEENYWRVQQKQTAVLRDQLLGWANAAQAGIQQLQAQQPAWNATLQRTNHTPDLGPTLDVIKKAVTDLQKVTKRRPGRTAGDRQSADQGRRPGPARARQIRRCRRRASTSTAGFSNATACRCGRSQSGARLAKTRAFRSASNRLHRDSRLPRAGKRRDRFSGSCFLCCHSSERTGCE